MHGGGYVLFSAETTLSVPAQIAVAGGEEVIPIDYKLTIDGDKLKGKGSSEFGGDKQEWDIAAKREKKDQ